MEKETILAKDLVTVEEGKISLDAACKKLLVNKIILARILKECVEEYRECVLSEIEENYIEGMENTSQEAVHRDEIPLIRGSRNEDSAMEEGTVTYDIRFHALAPHPAGVDGEKEAMQPKRTVRLNMDVEGQTDFYPGYPLPKRGIYYGSRMISSQYGRVFVNSHYEKIEKVYSIWVCINPPAYRRNSINRYTFHEEQLYGKIEEKKENYDLIAVIMICLGDEEAADCVGLLRLLSELFSIRKNAEEKKKILESEFSVRMTQQLEGAIGEMCNFSKYVVEMATKSGLEQGMKEGLEKGMERGIERGMEKGMENAILASVRNLLKNTDMTLEQVMNALEIPEEEKAVYAGRLDQAGRTPHPSLFFH